jgi:site-specific DNA-methyltransferase (cytosine-N4-specific)
MNNLNNWFKNSKNISIDWNFPEARREKTLYLSHGIHKYVSKYIPQIPNQLIRLFSNKNDIILDNFVGSGTTLVEASLLGRNSIGIDINPYACLISEVKTTKLNKKDVDDLNSAVKEISKHIISLRRQSLNINERSNYRDLEIDNRLKNNHFISRLYSTKNLNELLTINSVINNMNGEEKLKKILLLCLLGILRKVSYLSSNFGNDYVPRNKTKKTDVLTRYLSEYDNILNRLKKYNESLVDNCTVKVINDDTRKLPLQNESIDLIVTHPPYISAIPYAEYLKLEMLWMGLDPKKFNDIIIGGKRNSNTVVERFYNNMEKSFNEMYRVLKKDKFACVVIGNARVKGKIIESNKELTNQAINKGFKFVQDICRNKLDCANAWMKTEHILIFKKV